jgi:hypothetical protein
MLINHMSKTTPKLQDVIAAATPNLTGAESREMEDLTEHLRHLWKSNDYRQTDRVYHSIDMGEA